MFISTQVWVLKIGLPGVYNPPEKKLDIFEISGMCLDRFGRVLEVFLDDFGGTFSDMFGRFLRIFWRVFR